jgi:two-component sensor histidine kinase
LHDLADTIELVVSELVTNAVKASTDQNQRPQYTDEHGLACIHLRLSTDRQAALVEVWDENFTLPAPKHPDLDDESGRGLMLVEALAERWGGTWPPLAGEDRVGADRGVIAMNATFRSAR